MGNRIKILYPNNIHVVIHNIMIKIHDIINIPYINNIHYTYHNNCMLKHDYLALKTSVHMFLHYGQIACIFYRYEVALSDHNHCLPVLLNG